MGSLEDPCVPQAQGPGKQWKDKAFKEGTPGLRQGHFHSSCQVPWVSCASTHLHHIPFPCLLCCIQVAYVSSQEQENKHHRGDKPTWFHLQQLMAQDFPAWRPFCFCEHCLGRFGHGKKSIRRQQAINCVWSERLGLVSAWWVCERQPLQ